jgi:predicted transglutaminase-like cysteine proteinase
MVPKFVPTVALSLTQNRLVLTVAQDSGSIWVLDNVDPE